VDSGWDRTQPRPQIHAGVGLVDCGAGISWAPTSDDHDRVGHGTASIDLISDIAPNCDIFPIRVFGTRMETDVQVIRNAIRWGIDAEMKILNLSLGSVCESAIRPMYVICEEARKKGLILVSANHNSRAISYPAAFENVIGVNGGVL
jgi:hypothetical protein